MAIPNYIQKTLVMKPEVTKIFEDLETYLDFCKQEMLAYNEADLYNKKSPNWVKFTSGNKKQRPAKGSFKKESND